MIVGRDEEWISAVALLDRLATGPCALFVEGEPGIGKTTIFEALVARARGLGVQVLRCRPSQAQVRLPHAGLMEVLDGIGADLIDDLPGPQRRAMRIALRWEDPGPLGAEPQTVAAATGSVFQRLARDRWLLLAVDDLQWLDDASAQALEYAVRRVEGGHLAVLGAARSAEGRARGPWSRPSLPTVWSACCCGGWTSRPSACCCAGA
ncbi:MAG: ATP-binding protein [Thermoleophilia bacterium]